MASSIFKNLSRATATTLVKIFNLGTVGGNYIKPLTNPVQIDSEINKALGSLGVSSGHFASVFATMLRTEVERKRQYMEYDTMDTESEVIATALDIYAEDASDFDTFVGSRIWITSSDEKLQKSAMEMLQKLRVEKNLPRIARNLAKYGDFFLRVKANKDRKDTTDGIEYLDTSYYPRDVTPIVKDHKLLGYWIADAEHATAVEQECLFAPWEFVHFAVPGDSNFVKYDMQTTMEVKREDRVEYGQSLLKAARKAYKRSKMMHDILAISRMTRSTLRRVFKFQTETDSPVKSITALATFKKTMEKIGGIDKLQENMNYEELLNILTQDVYIPILKDGRGDYAFESVGGEVDVTSIVDIDLFDNRLYMSLRIPKEFLNFDEASGDKTTLLLKDIRYSKRIKKLQNAIRNGVKELIFIHFALEGKEVSENDFEVNMTSTSVSEDLERLDYYGNAVQTADSLIRMLESFSEGDGDEEGAEAKVPADKAYLVYYIMQNIVKLPSFDLATFWPPTKKYVDGDNKDEKQNKKAKNAETIVENHKELIESIMNKNFGKLTEATEEQINAHVIKDYKKGKIPENWDHQSLRTFCEGLIKDKQKGNKDD